MKSVLQTRVTDTRMLARVLFVSGLAVIVARRFISSHKKKKQSVQESLTEETKSVMESEVLTEGVSTSFGDTKVVPEAEESITFSATTVTRETSAVTDGEESFLDSAGEAMSALKSVDVISIDVEATSKSVDRFVVDGVTPRSNSLKKFADSMKRKISGSRKSTTP